MPCVSVGHIHSSKARVKAERSAAQSTGNASLIAQNPPAMPQGINSQNSSTFQKKLRFLKSKFFKAKTIATSQPEAASNEATTSHQVTDTAKISEGFIKIPHTPSRRPFSNLSNTQGSDRSGSLMPRFRSRCTRSDLINAESRLGSQLFGPIPAGHRREFFHDCDNVWIWHEDWTDHDTGARQLTVRYEVRPSGVYKKIAAGYYLRLEGDELENFRRAAHLYLATIKAQLYHVD